MWLPRADILSFEELARLVDVFLALGVEKIRLTGGEPLLRRDLDVLVGLLAGKPGLRDLALTTNGILLAQQATALKRAGLGRLTVSLDTLRPERFRALTRRDEHARVLEGLAAAGRRASRARRSTRSSCAASATTSSRSCSSAREQALEVRFIEYMDVGGATGWNASSVVRARDARPDQRASGGSSPTPHAISAPASAVLRGRHALRHHRLDHRAVQLDLRPRAPDGRRGLYTCLRAHRHRCAARCAGGTGDALADPVLGPWRLVPIAARRNVWGSPSGAAPDCSDPHLRCTRRRLSARAECRLRHSARARDRPARDPSRAPRINAARRAARRARGTPRAPAVRADSSEDRCSRTDPRRDRTAPRGTDPGGSA